jgi:hypothetical protein
VISPLSHPDKRIEMTALFKRVKPRVFVESRAERSSQRKLWVYLSKKRCNRENTHSGEPHVNDNTNTIECQLLITYLEAMNGLIV